jgi:transcriptional regulator with XRE-family HTH domain
MSLLRRELGVVLRRRREDQHKTLRDVARAAGVSLGYLSEVERGVKEASSELLAAICGALSVGLPEILVEVADALFLADALAASGRAAVGFVPATLVVAPAPPASPAVASLAAGPRAVAA